MSTAYKTFLSDDVVNTRSLLHEGIPITGSLVSGSSYSDTQALACPRNVKQYTHKMYESVYDYPYLSSSANHLFDITWGCTTDSEFYNTANPMNTKRVNIYNTMAQVLMGHDATGNINKFDLDGDILAGGTKIKDCFFLNFSRLMTKDEIKKGTVNIQIGVSGGADTPTSANSAFIGGHILTITDTGAETAYKVNSPSGEYGILSCSLGQPYNGAEGRVGLVFYQAGVVVLTSSIFQKYAASTPFGVLDDDPLFGFITGSAQTDLWTRGTVSGTMGFALATASQHELLDSFRRRVYNISFQNTTELNSSIYFCRFNHNDFNYSSNPTYLSSSKLIVKNTKDDAPVSYITGVGLYGAQGQLLAVGKLSEPLKKSPDTEITLRTRLDF